MTIRNLHVKVVVPVMVGLSVSALVATAVHTHYMRQAVDEITMASVTVATHATPNVEVARPSACQRSKVSVLNSNSDVHNPHSMAMATPGTALPRPAACSHASTVHMTAYANSA